MITRWRDVAPLLALSMAMVVIAGCTASSSSGPSTAALATKYLAIATPANHALDTAFDALDDDDDLGASSTVLHTIVTTERDFDRDLLALKLPAQMAARASALVQANEARADLTEQAMGATSLASLRRYKIDLDAMNVPVEAQVRLLRKDLGLPPPDTD